MHVLYNSGEGKSDVCIHNVKILTSQKKPIKIGTRQNNQRWYVKYGHTGIGSQMCAIVCYVFTLVIS